MKWPEERIEAYKRYVERDNEKLAYWKRELAREEEAVERTKRMISQIEKERAKTVAELLEQGVVIELREAVE